mmetsp:Transcript_2381/g.4331  ORF Transcript_2381/g.4331 Transcript_2381/m.4331 type:complete len:603 (+) Transcript_2381:58-1866(+)
MLVDQRHQQLRHDALQVKSINDFTDSLAKALSEGEGTPSKELTRELLAEGLRRALEIGGDVAKKRFLEALAANIHKFALQEQYSLSRVYPVEISSEYSNLSSFFTDGGPGAEDAGSARGLPAVDNATIATAEPAAMSELRRRLPSLPPKPGAGADELMNRFRELQTSQALQAVDARTRASFFGEVRLNLFRFTDLAQKELVDVFPELKAEVVRLVDSMTQEIAVWLDEERIASQGGQVPQASVVSKLRSLFQAVLSAPFLATFRHLGAGEKRAKEAFLLKIALCLKICAKQFGEMTELVELSGQLRRSFFYVEGYGELMEEWLQNRVKTLNEEFVQRAAAKLGANLAAVLARLRQQFLPGRWLFLSDPKVEADLITLLVDDAFPRHVVTVESFKQVLQKVRSFGGDDFHCYRDVVRLPPRVQQHPLTIPRDMVETALFEVFRRLPAFPSITRAAAGPGHFLFGRLEVIFQLQGTELMAQVVSAAPGMASPPQELVKALDFFEKFGPQEFPTIAAEAVKASESFQASPLTAIQDLGAPALPPPVPLSQQGFGAFPQMPPPPPMAAPGSFAKATSFRPPAPGGYGAPAPPLMPTAKFGLEDDEI